jgi:hypothetical protein
VHHAGQRRQRGEHGRHAEYQQIKDAETHIKDNLQKLDTIDNIESLMKAAKKADVALAVDPLVYTALDGNWINTGALQRKLLDMQALHRASLGDNKGFEGSGADYFARYKPTEASAGWATLRAPQTSWIKARLAGNSCSIAKSRNAEPGRLGGSLWAGRWAIIRVVAET